MSERLRFFLAGMHVMQAIFFLMVILLAGCTTAPRNTVVPVNVAVPVYCKAEVPTRPAMPTDTVPTTGKDFIFVFNRAAMAEIVLREAYEDRLLTALKSCMKKD